MQYQIFLEAKSEHQSFPSSAVAGRIHQTSHGKSAHVLASLWVCAKRRRWRKSINGCTALKLAALASAVRFAERSAALSRLVAWRPVVLEAGTALASAVGFAERSDAFAIIIIIIIIIDTLVNGHNLNMMQGYIDELRVSSTARYSTNFTPSTTAFVPDESTLLLNHFDTTSINAPAVYSYSWATASSTQISSQDMSAKSALDVGRYTLTVTDGSANTASYDTITTCFLF